MVDECYAVHQDPLWVGRSSAHVGSVPRFWRPCSADGGNCQEAHGYRCLYPVCHPPRSDHCLALQKLVNATVSHDPCHGSLPSLSISLQLASRRTSVGRESSHPATGFDSG